MRSIALHTNGTCLLLVILVLALPLPIHLPTPVARGSAPSGSPEGQATGTLDALGALPLSFIPNRGQWDEAVRFRTQGPGGTVYLAADGVVLVLERRTPSEGTRGGGSSGLSREPPAGALHTAVTLRFLDANPRPEVEGLDPLPGTASFFLGNDPADWRSGLPTFAGVRYRELWPGIDLVYRSRPGELKSEFIVAPGADPGLIQVRYEGAARPVVDGAGRLVLATEAGDLVEEAPLVFQEVEGERVPVAARYRLGDDGSVGFALGPYDREAEVVIDPQLSYSTFVGGSSYDHAWSLALDSTGEPVVAGATRSADFPTTPGAYDTSHGMNTDLCVFKLAADGASMVYSTYVGSGQNDSANALVLDGSGRAVVTGFSQSSDFPTTPGAYDTSFGGGGGDAFVLKLSADGSSLLYSTLVGGSSDEEGRSLALDGAGQAVVTGWTESSDFPATPGAYDTSHNGGDDVFVLKLAADGSSLLYSTFVGGSSDDQGWSLALDGTGRAVSTGETASSDFPTTPGSFDRSHNEHVDAFVLKLSADGGSLLRSTFLGGDSDDSGYALALDDSGQIFVTGRTYSYGPSDFPTTVGAYDTSHNGGDDVFVLRLDAAASSLQYSTFLGGSIGEQAFALEVDSTGQAVVSGYTTSSEFPTTPGAFDTNYGGGYDAFVVKLAAGGGSLLYSTFLGGSDYDSGFAMALDGAGQAVVAGRTQSSDFPTTPGAYDTTHNWGDDIFVLRLAAFPPPAPTLAAILNPDGDGDYLVDWSDLTVSATYTLEEDDNPAFSSAVVRYAGPASQFEVLGKGIDVWYYRVRASNDGGDSPWSNVESVGVVPDAPVLLAIGNADGDGSYLVDWDEVSGATGYTLEEDDNPAFPSPIVRFQGAGSQLQITDQTGGAWTYRVRASSAGGNSPWSNTESTVVIPGTPELVPIDNADGDGTYVVAWNSEQGASEYTLEEDDDPGFASPSVRYLGTGTDVQVTGQVAGTWHYRVRASNVAGDSPWSSVELTHVLPAAPTLYQIDNPSGGSVYVVDWSSVQGATGYTLEEDDHPGFTSSAIRYQGTGTQFLVSAQEGGTWYYRTRSANAGGDGPWSNVESTTVKPEAPLLFPIANGDGNGNYLVDWSTPQGTMTYTLEVDGNLSFTSPLTVYQGTVSQHAVSSQPVGTWYYRAQASNTGGDSAWSNVEAVDVLPDAPVLSPIDNSDWDGHYLVNWSQVTDATAYTLEEDDAPDFPSPTLRYSGGVTECLVTSQADGLWYYRVLASGTHSSSLWSNTESASVDTAPPASTADSPAYASPSTIEVSWTASDAVSGLANTILYVRKSDGAWASSGLPAQPGLSGAFPFGPTDGDGIYYFQTISEDRAGNVEDGPSGNGDTWTEYDSQSPASEASSPAYDNEGSIAVDWTASALVSHGVLSPLDHVLLWYRYESATWTNTMQSQAGGSGTFDFLPLDGNGTYHFATQAFDAAGNEEAEPTGGGDAQTVYDTVPPASVADSPPQASPGRLFEVAWNASDATSGVDSTCLWTKYGGAGTWTDTGNCHPGTAGEFTFTPQQGQGTYFFQTVTTDEAGNVEAGPAGDGDTRTEVRQLQLFIHLPLVMRGFFLDRYEPNDTFDQAWGPLASGQTYHAYFPSEADENDYYFFVMTDAHSVEIWLTDIPDGNDYDLYLYNAAHVYEDHSGRVGSVDEHIFQASLDDGTYYIRLTREAGTSSSQPYALRVVFQD